MTFVCTHLHSHDSSCSGGFLPWEYQQHAQLRGALHPTLFAALYQTLKWLGIDTQWSVVSLA
jgi:hypothetical protein